MVMDKNKKRHNVFMSIAGLMSTLSDCPSRKVGAVLVKDNRILSTGYNGTPRNSKSRCCRCSSNVKSGTQLNACYCVHAEINCIIQAARFGVSSDGAIIYCTTKPCLDCVKASINAGILKIIYLNDYNTKYPKEVYKLINIKKYKGVI
jgi:dCMP deaminase